MTKVQEQAIPVLLQGKDLIAQAKTGSGKTAAFGIPVIMGIDIYSKDPQVLIMTPTRELAEQVSKELRKLARYKDNIKIVTLAGGTPMRPQINSLEQGAHIIVGTPGRLQDHLSRETIPLYDISTLVLDEGDRMLDMGFFDAISKIISNLPPKRQTMLFSATFPDKIEQLSREILKTPERIIIEDSHSKQTIRQVAYRAETHEKQKILLQIISTYKPRSVLIFCNTKIVVDELANWLYSNNYDAQALHGDLNQRERNEALLMFANGTMPVLVATDVASRGLDVKDIDLIVNYDLPHDPEAYIHRIGRTGRAGTKGVAASIYLPNQKFELEEVAPEVSLEQISYSNTKRGFTVSGKMKTLCIDGGKKDKLRAGDMLGTLCKEIGIDGRVIGKIEIFDRKSYVAVDSSVSAKALDGIQRSRIKNKKFRVWIL